MIKDEVVENLVSEVEEDSHRSKIKEFLNGEIDNFLDIYNKIVEKISTETEIPFFYLSHFLEFILPIQDNSVILKRQDELIKHWIVKFSKDELKIYCLFSAIAKLDNNRKKEYIKLLINSNESFEDFKKIPLTPTSYGCDGSLIPLYNSWIEYLKSLLSFFVGLKWIEHKGHIEKQIDYLRDKIKSEETKEFLGVF